MLQSHPHEGSKCSASSDAFDRSASCHCVDAAVSASGEKEKFNSARDFEKNSSPCTLTALCVIFFVIISLVSCSCDLLTVLNHFCCLRCSKIIAALSDHECEVVKNVHCNCCSKSQKFCDNVCEMLTKHRV